MNMKIKLEDNKKVDAHFDGFTVRTDQSVKVGGEGSAPAPYDYFLASIGTCAGIYIKGFCDSRGISSDGIEIDQNLVYDPVQRKIGQITLDIKVPSDFPEKYRETLIKVAGQCAVKKTIENPPEFITSISTN
jgi:putative redox protein